VSMPMSATKLGEIAKELVAEELDVFVRKSAEYSGESNALSNFERLAERLGLHPMQVLQVYYTKHEDGIMTFIKTHKIHSNEDVLGRIVDARNYMTILFAMIKNYRELPPEHPWHLPPFEG